MTGTPAGPGAASPDGARLDLEKLVRENLDWLRRWMRGRLGNTDLADDLCQEAFLHALRRVGDLRDQGRFRAWLYRIAENTLRDHVRNEVRRRKRVKYTGQIEEFERSAPAADLGRRESAEKLLEAIRALPPRLREPLLLRHSSGLSYSEIAKMLRISENAVQVRIFRARRRLREENKQLGFGFGPGE